MWAIFSDIHGNLPALEAAIADAESRGCSEFINLGDILSGPLWPRETADFLMKRSWTTIRGNHERQLLTLPRGRLNRSDTHTIAELSARHIAWIGGLHATMELEADLFLCHGTPDSDLRYFLEHVDEGGTREATIEEVAARAAGRPERVILCGHTHIPRDVLTAAGKRIVNPGSVGLPAYDDEHPFPHIMETGSPEARYAILDGEQIQLLAVTYDHESAATQAERNGRNDWAHALRHGLMAPA